MANTPPLVTSGMSYATFAAAVVDLVQKKVDRRGSEVSAEDLATRAGALWPNMVDDTLLALWSKVDGMGASSAVTIDTRSSPTVTGSATSGGGTVDFQIAIGKERMTVDWLRVVSNAPSTGGTVEFFADSGRTKSVYLSQIASGSPPVASADFYDGTPFACVSSDGTSLGDQILYGTITNDGGSNSTYTVYLVGNAY